MDGEFQQDGMTDIAPAGWPKAIGVLSMVFGILGITCGVLGLGMLAFFGSVMGNVMSGQLGPNTPPPPFTPPMDAFLIVTSAIGFMLNGLLIFAGVQLMRRRQAGRSLHLVYAVVGVFIAFIGSYVGFRGQQAQSTAMQAWITQYGESSDTAKQIKQSQQQQAQFQGTVQIASMMGGLGLTLAWPVFCIVWFGMAKKVVPPDYEF